MAKRVADAFREIEELREDVKKLRVATMATATALLVSVSVLTYLTF